MMTTAERRRLSKKLSKRLHSFNGLIDDPAYYYVPHTIEQLKTYPDELLHRLNDFTRDADRDTLKFIITMLRENNDERFLHDAMTYLPLLPTNRFWTDGMIMSLQVYKKYPWIPRVPDEEQAQAVAQFLIATHAVIDETMDLLGENEYENEEDREMYNPDETLELMNPYGFGRSHWVFTDERTARLIFDHPELGPSIINAVKERGTLRYDVIQPVVTHSEAALSGGVL